MKASEKIYARLVDAAHESAKPDVRLGTLGRLKEACDAIECGEAAALFQKVSGKQYGSRADHRINPSNISRYVEARGRLDKAWKGPKRVYLQQDIDLKSYVDARENERVKPRFPVRQSDRRRRIEDAISQLHSIDAKMEIRHELEEGRRARKELQLISEGLRKLPGIDIDTLLGRRIDHGGPEETVRAVRRDIPLQSSAIPALSGGAGLTHEQAAILIGLVQRLTDDVELKMCGLYLKSGRVRALGTERTLVKAQELQLLCFLAGTDG